MVMSGVWKSSVVSGIEFFTPTNSIEMAWVPVGHAVVDRFNKEFGRTGRTLLFEEDECETKPGYYLCSGKDVRTLL